MSTFLSTRRCSFIVFLSLLAVSAGCGSSSGAGGYYYIPVDAADGTGSDGSDAANPDANPADAKTDTVADVTADATDLDATETLDTVDATDVPDGTDTTDVPDTTDVFDTTDTTEVQDTTDAVDTTDVVDTTDTTDTMDVPDTTDTMDVPDTTDTSDTTDAADTTDTTDGVVGPACAPTPNIAGLLQCPEGKVDVTLKAATVTYVFNAGYFLADESTTHGIEVYVGTTWTYPKPVVGDRVDLHLTEWGNWKNQQEITAADAPVALGVGNPAVFKLDLQSPGSAGVLAETHESREVGGTGLKVLTVAGADLTVASNVLPNMVFRVDGTSTLCKGAVFELKSAVITQFGEIYRVQLMNGAADLGTIDISGCTPDPIDETQNWGFEDLAATDPPAGFVKLTGLFSALRTTTVAHAGAASCELIWTSDANQDFTTGAYAEILPGDTVKFSFWVLDEDVAGRVRPGLLFYKADKTFLKSEYATGYSVDAAGVWNQLAHTFVAPADAAFVRGQVRMYDVAPFPGSAKVRIDDWSIGKQ